jgi:hypothetical protein
MDDLVEEGDGKEHQDEVRPRRRGGKGGEDRNGTAEDDDGGLCVCVCVREREREGVVLLFDYNLYY